MSGYIFGVWLSLVERYVRDVEVASSNLVTPTWSQGLNKGIAWKCSSLFFYQNCCLRIFLYKTTWCNRQSLPSRMQQSLSISFDTVVWILSSLYSGTGKASVEDPFRVSYGTQQMPELLEGSRHARVMQYLEFLLFVGLSLFLSAFCPLFIGFCNCKIRILSYKMHLVRDDSLRPS